VRILVADDHEIIRNATARILHSRADIECFEAKTGKEAVEKAIVLKPALVILDISMPDIDGFHAATEIKRHLPDVRILFFSIYNDPEYLEQARSIGEGAILKDRAGTMLLKAVDALLQEQTFFPSTEDAPE
jgi:DNA-binding NarL/FixJ family response regulator